MKTTHAVRAAAVVALAGLAPGALAVPVPLAVDDAQSSLAVEVSTTVFGFPFSEMDSSPVAGTAEVDLTLDGSGQPDTIALNDFAFQTSEELSVTFSVPFAGTLSITLPAGTQANYVTPGTPTAAVPVATDGSFTIPMVSTALVGTADVTGTQSFADATQTLDLSTFDAPSDDLTGTVTVAGDQVTLVFDVAASATEDVDIGGGVFVPVTVSAAASVVATGTLPPDCQPDLSGDGFLNTTDINLFVSAFLASDAAADFNDDGFFNTTDINLFVAAFLAGCD